MQNEKIAMLLAQLEQVVYGKEQQCRLALTALLAEGDLL